MKSSEFKEILKKCFGKGKNSKYHSIAMLIIYTIFIFIVVMIIRLGDSSTNNQNSNNNVTPSSTPTATSTPSTDVDEDDDINVNDVNYSYSYTVTYNGVSEVYLGKKVDDKEKFTLVKDGVTTDYAILSDNYLILENDIYRIIESPTVFFRYCDVEKILLLVESEIPTENANTIKYNVSNSSLAGSYNDNLMVDNGLNNLVTLTTIDNVLKSVDLDLSNYISSVEGFSSTLTIHMEFVDIGTTEDFEIKVS